MANLDNTAARLSPMECEFEGFEPSIRATIGKLAATSPNAALAADALSLNTSTSVLAFFNAFISRACCINSGEDL
eukprot:8951862-Pyramimonas_sp.AAC.1